MEKKKQRPAAEKVCFLCGRGGTHIELLHKGVRDNADIDVLRCKKCGLLFLSDDSHINTDFYAQGGMIGGLKLQNWINNTAPDDKRRFDELLGLIKDKTVTDFGCGNAGFLNLAKDVCKKVYGVELQSDLYGYFDECGLEVHPNIREIPEKSDIITMFHVLEHIKDPVEILESLKPFLKENGRIFIEVPNSKDVLIGLYNCKSFQDFVYWSCHLYVFDEKTLATIIKKAGYKIKKLRHIQRYSLMNHLHWLFKHKPGGHKIWARYDFRILNAIYHTILKLFKITDTITVEIEDKGI